IHQHANANANGHTNGNGHSHQHTHANANSYANINANSNTKTYFDARIFTEYAARYIGGLVISFSGAVHFEKIYFIKVKVR
ncbi:MAG: hypothetical protein WAU96_16135, partial [Anaerolineae bacterium]